jgi:hypothetical protein
MTEPAREVVEPDPARPVQVRLEQQDDFRIQITNSIAAKPYDLVEYADVIGNSAVT